MKKLSLVLPVYNEEIIIEDTIKSVIGYMEINFKDNYEIILVDDGSRDSTLSKAEKYKSGSLKIIFYETNMGKGYAVRQGMLAAENEYVIFTDSDLAYGLDVIGECVEMFEGNPNADIIIGSRKLHKEGYASYTFIRRFASKTFLLLLKIIGGLKVSDSQTGFKGFKNAAAKKVFSYCEENRWSFDFEVLLTAQKLKTSIKEMPVKIINHRESKINLLKDSIRMFRDILKIKKKIKKKDIKYI